ncbi:MAG: heparan-alpha-glucosaminide N-acetyltransferase domain-containing protein [Candidatus Thalassarchaeaceae archaeon]|nr:heparan-alpha-glucosaminide N-acetyltransferase domain-containing protein [Candidatus Thalassarchaeaceae archaeon]
MSLRLNHVDSMRGFAILCMVQVHTAALLPAPVSTTHPLAFVSAAIGGMAAPMFVTISGWGLHRGLKRRKDNAEPILKWVITRGSVLILLQFLIGFLLPQRYYWNSPGILTLLGLCIFIVPLISHREFAFLRWAKDKESRLFKPIAIIIFSAILLHYFPNLIPGPRWDDLVSVKSISHWFQLAFFSGTYPLFPWIAFYYVGSTLDAEKLNENWKLNITQSGSLAISTLLATMVISMTSNTIWAATMGEGVLTFFPANHWFVIVSATWTIFLWDLFRMAPSWMSKTNDWLAPSGKLSLTIYVLHFALLGAVVESIPEITLIVAFGITLLHMGLWLMLGLIHEKMGFKWSIEYVIRKIATSKSQHDESE